MRPSEKTKSVTLGYPFCLLAEGFGEWGLWFTRAASCAIRERLGTSLVPPPIDGNVASCFKPRHHFLVPYKLHQPCETNKKQSICWKILSTLYPPNLLLPPLNFQEFPWQTPMDALQTIHSSGVRDLISSSAVYRKCAKPMVKRCLVSP